MKNMTFKNYLTPHGYYGALRAGARTVLMPDYFANLLSVLPGLGVPMQNVYDITWNVHLVAKGIRTATLIEKADFGEPFDNVVVALNSVVVGMPNVRTVVRNPESMSRQFLVYNTTRVSPEDLRLAIDETDPPAMGRVLGFQCAGDLSSPYTVTFYLHVNDTTIEPVAFYAEMCATEPNTDIVNRQRNAFNEEAAKFGWSVSVETEFVPNLDMILTQLMSGDAAIDTNALSIQLQNHGFENFENLVEEKKPLTRQFRVILATALLYVSKILDHYQRFHDEYDELIESGAMNAALAKTENLLIHAKTPALLGSLEDVVKAAVAQRYESLNNCAPSIMNALRRVMPKAVSDKLGTPKTPSEWDAVATLLALTVVHDCLQTIKDRDTDGEELALYETIHSLTSLLD